MRYIEGDGDGGRIVWSASDLKAAAECEFAWLRQIDAKLGRVSAVEEPQDLTLERAGRRLAHDRRVVENRVVGHEARTQRKERNECDVAFGAQFQDGL
mgnify:CR=1 FL=1